MKYICIRTFVTSYGEFKRYHHGEEIKEKDFSMLSFKDQINFVKLFNND